MAKTRATRLLLTGAPSMNQDANAGRPSQSRCSMAATLGAICVVAAGFLVMAAPARAQSSQGLFWQCVAADSTHPQPQYCPVSNAYPLPNSAAAASSGGGAVFRSTNLTNTAVAVDASPGTVSFVHSANTGGSAALCYLQLYDAKAADVTVGTTTPTVTLAIAASTVLSLPFSVPIQFSTAISVAATTTAGGGTACSPILQSTLIVYK